MTPVPSPLAVELVVSRAEVPELALVEAVEAGAETDEVVTVAGVVRKDKDFGAGYSYQVLIEDATLTRP